MRWRLYSVREELTTTFRGGASGSGGDAGASEPSHRAVRARCAVREGRRQQPLPQARAFGEKVRLGKVRAGRLHCRARLAEVGGEGGHRDRHELSVEVRASDLCIQNQITRAGSKLASEPPHRLVRRQAGRRRDGRPVSSESRKEPRRGAHGGDEGGTTPRR